MTPERILELANRPDVPKFIFGSRELEAWTAEHIDRRTGVCTKWSIDWYVVIHRSLNPQQQDFRVLSCWRHGDVAPRSEDIPAATVAQESQPKRPTPGM